MICEIINWASRMERAIGNKGVARHFEWSVAE